MMRRPELPMAPDTTVEMYLEGLRQCRSALQDVSLQLDECKHQWDSQQCQSQGMEDRLNELAVKAHTLKNDIRAQATRFEHFQQSRHRFLDLFALTQSDVAVPTDMRDRLDMSGVHATEDCDCYADAILYAQDKRSDADIFEKLYAFSVDDILDMASTYRPGLKIINTYVMITRSTGLSENFFHLIRFAFLRFSYRAKFWLKRNQVERTIFKKEVDSAVVRFWRIYETQYIVD
ncbi:hypothetical protein KEM54_005318 [Ascosphaera aggregata]|nr:hypothetical protein KEM54_005318 [Ascosphaera aggregata]